MDYRKPVGSVVAGAMDALKTYEGPGVLPPCPMGGRYTIGVIGDPPRCSVHGKMDRALMWHDKPLKS